jgi:hypothetical protein
MFLPLIQGFHDDQVFALSAFVSVWRRVVVGRADVSEEHVGSVHPTRVSPEDDSSMFLLIVGNTANFRCDVLN